jgi:hypothetical protein
MLGSGEIADPERYWCGTMQAAKKPGLMKKEQGEFNQSGFQPSGNRPPVPPITCIGWR